MPRSFRHSAVRRVTPMVAAVVLLLTGCEIEIVQPHGVPESVRNRAAYCVYFRFELTKLEFRR